MLVAPASESPGARQPAVETTVAAGGLGGSERSASMEDGSETVPVNTAEAAGAVGAEPGVASNAPESRVEKPGVSEEQTALPEASEGMVGPAVQAPSPQVVHPATAEEDEVEEIEHAEP